MLHIKGSSPEHSRGTCVDIHSRSSADQQFRAQGSAHRTYYCCTFSIVNVETYSCYVVSRAVLCKTITHIFIFLLRAYLVSFYTNLQDASIWAGVYQKLCTVGC